MYFADTDVQMTQFQAHYRHLLGKLASLQHDLKRYKSTEKPDGHPPKNSVKTLWAWSQKAYQHGKYKQVEALLKRLLKLYPKTLIRYDAYLLLGDSLGQRKRHFDSILWFNKARQWYRKLGNIPDKALLRLAHAHYKIKICNVAHGFLKKLLHVAPKSPYAEQARLWRNQWKTSCFADPKTY